MDRRAGSDYSDPVNRAPFRDRADDPIVFEDAAPRVWILFGPYEWDRMRPLGNGLT